MVILVLVALLVLIVATVFVSALTASFSSIEARLDRLTAGTPIELRRPSGSVPTGVGGATGRPGSDLVGHDLDGSPLTAAVVGVEHFTLLAFLSSGCSTCGRFWKQLRGGGLPDLGLDTRLIVLAKGADAESMTALHEVAAGVDVLLSTEAWQDYEVPGTPFFILVDGRSGLVRGEGTAMGWDEVRNLVALGRGDASIVTGVSTATMKPSSDAEREAIVDQLLMDAGVFPGDPSLYPGTTPPEVGSP
jgi:hypothetical protein